jgi:tetratricopeptide (TPR) repeat protein
MGILKRLLSSNSSKGQKQDSPTHNHIENADLVEAVIQGSPAAFQQLAAENWADLPSVLRGMYDYTQTEGCPVGADELREEINRIMHINKLIETMGKSAIPALIQALTHKDPKIRKQGCHALRILSRQHSLPIEAIIAIGFLSGDSIQSVSGDALFFLKELAEEKTDLLPALPNIIRGLKNPNPNVRMESSEIIGKMGYKATTAINDLSTLLNDTNVDVVKAARGAIVSLGGKVEVPMPESSEKNMQLTRLVSSSKDGDEKKTLVPIAQGNTVIITEPLESAPKKIKSPPKTGNAYVDSCFWFDFEEIDDERKWHAIDGLKNIISLAENGETEKALSLAEASLSQYPDYYFLYYWIGKLKGKMGQQGEPKKTYIEGLKKCRSKVTLCGGLAMMGFEANNLSDAVMWWIKSCAIQLSGASAEDGFSFLNLAYIAKGLGLANCNAALLEQTDRRLSIRFDAEGAIERYNLAANQGSEPIRQAILLLCDYYIQDSTGKA